MLTAVPTQLFELHLTKCISPNKTTCCFLSKAYTPKPLNLAQTVLCILFFTKSHAFLQNPPQLPNEGEEGFATASYKIRRLLWHWIQASLVVFCLVWAKVCIYISLLNRRLLRGPFHCMAQSMVPNDL